MPIRVAIVAAPPLARAGLRQLVVAAGRHDVVATVATAGEVAQADGPAPDVVVADLDPGDGIGRWLDWLDAGVGVVLLAPPEAGIAIEDQVALLSRGAAWLPADCAEAEVAAAIDAAAVGLVALRPATLEAVLAEVERPSDPTHQDLIEPLTPRELEVLRLLAGGLGNKRIASRLAISEHTAKFHVGRILAKLDASSRAEAVAIGLRQRLIELA